MLTKGYNPKQSPCLEAEDGTGAAVGQDKEASLSVSMDTSRTNVVGNEYDKLFHTADQALSSAEWDGKGEENK